MPWRSRTPVALLALVVLALAAAPALGSPAGPSAGTMALNVVLGLGGLAAAGFLVYWNARPTSSAPRSAGPVPPLDPERAAAADARTAAARAARAERVAAAAEAAAAAGPWLAPATVQAEASRLAGDVLAAWDAADRTTLDGLLAPALLRGWVREMDRHADGPRVRMAVRAPVGIEYVGLVDEAGEAGDRVVVRLSAPVEQWVEDPVTGAGPRRAAALRRYWTLGRRDGRWILVADRDDTAAARILQARIVSAAPSGGR